MGSACSIVKWKALVYSTVYFPLSLFEAVLSPKSTLTEGIVWLVVSNLAISAASKRGSWSFTSFIDFLSSWLVYYISCVLPLTCPSRALAVVATKFWRECLSRFLKRGKSRWWRFVTVYFKVKNVLPTGSRAYDWIIGHFSTIFGSCSADKKIPILLSFAMAW